MSEKNVKKLILTDKFEIDILELPKIKGKESEKDKLIDWLMFFENPESGRVIQGMKENENLKEAVEKLDRISEDEEMQRLSKLREKAIRDEHAVYLHGLEVGEQSGKAEGKLENQIEVAKKMLKEKIDMELIGKITELSKEEIEKLAKDIENKQEL